MAASIFLHPIFISIIISITPQSLSQSSPPQNIQTFYPFSPPPPLIPPSPPPPPPINPPPTTSTPPPRRSSTRAAVGKAIGVTAATTAVLSGLLFFLLLRRSRRKRSEEINATAILEGTNNSSVPPSGGGGGGFTRYDGNMIKGLIVDENGLDVLYWRDLQEGENMTSSFKKQYYHTNLRDGDEGEQEEEKRMVSGRERKYSNNNNDNNNNNKSPIQEVPLLRGKSSTSQSPTWADDKEDEIMKKREPSFSTHRMMSFKAMEKQNSSVQQPLPPPPPVVAKMAAPPPPPPPMPPPPSNNSPTPPPGMAVGVVTKTAAPPPGPLLSGGAPPSRRSSSLGKGAFDDKNEQAKLKPLHWDKVNPNAVEHPMVWDKIDKGSFKFDGDLMEALFGHVATNRKSPQRDERSPSSPKESDKSGPPSQIFILDTRKSQNIAILLKSLGITRKEIIDALINGHGLTPDTIEKLTKIAPSDEEASQITAFDGYPTRLADAESFLYHLLKAVPSAFTRFNAMLFRSNYDLEVSSLKESLQSLELACNELRTRGLFLKLLEAVLKTGNRLNTGTSRENEQAFNLTALRKLSDVKSSDGKTTLLQFVVQEVVRAEGKRCVLNNSRSLRQTSSQCSNIVESQSSEQSKDDREREYMMLGLPVIGGLSAEFLNVKKAANLDYDHLVNAIKTLSEQLDEIRKIVSKCGNSGGFGREMNRFLDTAGLGIKVVKEEEMRVMELVKKTRDYYQLRDKGTNNALQLFVIVRDFLGMVDKVCIDVARNVQKRKMPVSCVAVGSSSSDSPRVFRFPKLPENFMSDNSKSSSSDSDDDSEARQ